jgi:hypothetical protein
MLSLNKGPKREIDMDQDELLANIREYLYNKPNKGDWEACRRLWLDWPEDELPDVVANYIYTTAFESKWKNYFTTRGYRKTEELLQAPAIERLVELTKQNAIVTMEAQMDKVKEVLSEGYSEGFSGGDENLLIKSVTLVHKAIDRVWILTAVDQIRKALLRKKKDKRVCLVNPQHWVKVTLNDDTEHTSDMLSARLMIFLRDGALVSEVEIDEEDLLDWSRSCFDEDWYYDEFYEDDWE